MSKSYSKKNITSFQSIFQLNNLFFSIFLLISYWYVTYKYQIKHSLIEKKFLTFEEFYPYYLTQHIDKTCQYLHVMGSFIVIVITATQPIILYVLLMSLVAGITTFQLTIHLSHGIYEIITVVIVYSIYLHIFQKIPGFSRKASFLPIIAYSFAWVGHFYFELNKPATFTYPAYSLMVSKISSLYITL